MKTGKIIIFTFILFIFFFFTPHSFAATSPDWTINFSWNDVSVNNNGQYDFPLNVQGNGTYTWLGGSAYGEIYK